MAEENKKVIEEVTEQVEQPKENPDQPRDDQGRFKSKFESAKDDSVTKIDLTKFPSESESEKVEQEPVKEEQMDVVSEEPKVQEVKEEVKEETIEETPTIQEVTNEEVANIEEQVEEQIEEAIHEAETTGKPLPENIRKLMDFMDETGGDLNDYVNLNRDISKMDESEIIDEYYRTTKSHLTPEERGFLLEDSFGYDEEVDDPREIRLKKIALKEQVAEAKAHLDRQKSKYYEEIKAGSKLTQEQQKAIDFFNRHNENSEKQKKLSEAGQRKFKQRTENVFNKNFKGFDFNVGDKKYRFNVKDADKVKESQSNLSNFVNKFVGEDNTIEDAAGYHKSLFTAMNADAVAKHFYEQGQADAIKGQVARDKNINTNPRKTHSETIVDGVKFKVLGDSADEFKFKIKSNKKKK